MKKYKILAFGIILCMLFSLAVMPVGAEREGNYTYTVRNGEATITGLYGSINDDIIIPSTLGGYPVTSIGEEAFSDYANITSITIPDSVISIGEDPFFCCESLTTITVSENNKNFSSIDGVLFNKDKTTLVKCPLAKARIYTIPNSVTSIGNCAFEDCSNLTSVTIPDSVISIGNYAFSFCTSLISITIPDSAISIGEEAFYYCTSLTSITIPDNVTNIGQNAFGSCTSLTDVYYGGTAEDWNKFDFSRGNRYLKNATKHYNHVGTKSLENTVNYNRETLTLIENGVLDIGENLYFRNGYVNASNGYIKSGDKKITGNRIYFDQNGKMRLDAGYTAKVERDNGDGTTDQGFMAGITNPNRVITMTLEVTGTANDVDYTGRTISKDFDFSDYEIAGLVNFGFTVTNIPKPLSLSIQSIE